MRKKSNGTPTNDRPETIYKLDLSVLRPGDVILTATPGYQSKIIRMVTGGNFSHAILVVKHPNGMEASDFGVVRFRLDRFIVRERENICVLRLKGQKPNNFEKSVIRFADSQTAKKYADYDVLTTPFSTIPRFEKQRFFCSQLEATCFKEAKIPGFESLTPEKISPETIASSELFEPVQNAIVETVRASFAFEPANFDGLNSQSPNERLTTAMQKVTEAVQPLYRNYGQFIGNLNDALIGLSRWQLNTIKYTIEVFQALLAAIIQNRIGEIGRDYWPANSDKFFIDVIVINSIVFSVLDTDKIIDFLTFYTDELTIAEQTLCERDDFITAAKAAYLASGLESIRYYLAGGWDFCLMHRRTFLAMERAVEILKIQLGIDDEALN